MTGQGQLTLSISEKERQAQIQEARRLSKLDFETPKTETKIERHSTPRSGMTHDPAHKSTGAQPPFKKKFVAKGHDAIVKDMQAKATPVFIESMAGDIIDGVFVGSDRYTISLKDSDGNVMHVYKHGIFAFGKQTNA